jgi:hypothetical protein
MFLMKSKPEKLKHDVFLVVVVFLRNADSDVLLLLLLMLLYWPRKS